MTPTDTVVWPLEPHTRVKHQILRRHLDGWLPIMTRSFPELLYVDGFAGPGVYADGAPGSPVIALRAAIKHTRLQNRPLPRGRLAFLFIEDDADRAARLRDEIRKLLDATSAPEWILHYVATGAFDSYVTARFDRLTLKGRRPMFVFIDPFGYAGVPMSLISRIARVPHSECLTNFAYSSIRRWGSSRNDPAKNKHVDELYGSPAWRDYRATEQTLVEFYRRQLVSCGGFKYNCTFKMQDRLGSTEYFLAFATNDVTGLNVMKRAMWKADPQTGHLFSDALESGGGMEQAQLFVLDPIAPLRDLLRREFRGKPWQSFEDIEEFVRHTPYSEEMHLKVKALRPMEAELGVLMVERPRNARKGSFPAGTRLLFT